MFFLFVFRKYVGSWPRGFVGSARREFCIVLDDTARSIKDIVAVFTQTPGGPNIGLVRVAESDLTGFIPTEDRNALSNPRRTQICRSRRQTLNYPKTGTFIPPVV